MSNPSNRRKFIKHIGIGGLATTITPATLLQPGVEQKAIGDEHNIFKSSVAAKHEYNSSYTGEYLSRIAFPIGGMGAGMYCLEGAGAISHMSVRNKPEVFNEPGLFAAIYIKGLKNGAKILEGPVPDWKKFGRPDAGNGSGGSISGLPHFQQAIFKARFPFATIDLMDKDMPLSIQLTGWSPFTPTDENNSSLPVGALEYSFTNTGTTNIDAVFSYNAKNFLKT